MSDIYEPKFLFSAKDKIEKLLPILGAEPEISFQNEKVEKFLRKVAEMDSEKVREYAEKNIKGMPDRIWWIARYLVDNQYDLDLSNLFDVMTYIGEETHFGAIIKDWENKYRKDDIRLFLYREYCDNPVFAQALISNGIDYENMKWLSSTTFIKDICASSYRDCDLDEFSEELLSLGVITNTELYNVCLSKYVLYCNRNSYRKIGDSKLAKCFSKLSEKKDKIQFCVNICRELNNSDFADFSELAIMVMDFKDRKDSWNELQNALQAAGVFDKFNSWIVTRRIEDFFSAYDDKYRLNFWKKYTISAKDAGNCDFALFIDFGQYVITEYKEKAGGPMYIFTKPFFEKNIRKMFERGWGYEKYEYKDRMKALWSNWEGKGFEMKINHQPAPNGWYWTFRSELLKRGVEGKWR